VLPASDSVLRNSDETDASALQDSKNSSSVTEALALPVLERHGETPTSLDSGGQSSLDGEAAGSASASAAAGGDSSTAADSEEAAVKAVKPFDDDDDREMPELTLYV